MLPEILKHYCLNPGTHSFPSACILPCETPKAEGIDITLDKVRVTCPICKKYIQGGFTNGELQSLQAKFPDTTFRT